jgi:hypothetical protein
MVLVNLVTLSPCGLPVGRQGEGRVREMIIVDKNRGIDIICKNFCKFYKPEKDEALACRGFDLVLNLVGEEKINEARILEITNFTLSDYPFDGLLKEHLCSKCDFVIDGCAFREGGGEKKIPCGGYLLLSQLLSKGLIKIKDISG